MKIVLHAGAYFTEEERLLKTLLRNAESFGRRGVAVPGPGRYRALMREVLGALEAFEPSEDAHEVLRDAMLDDNTTHRLILSHPRLFGIPRNCLRMGRLYDLAPNRMRRLVDLFAPDTFELYLTLRNPAALIPALYQGAPQKTLEAFLAGHDPREIVWSDTLRAIRETVPEVSITAWCFEDMPILWAEIVRKMAGLEPGEKIVGGFDLLSQIMSQEGMRRFRAYLKTQGGLNDTQKRRVTMAFLDKFALEDEIEEEIEAPNWSDDFVNEMTDIYDQDMLECARIPGVEMIAL